MNRSLFWTAWAGRLQTFDPLALWARRNNAAHGAPPKRRLKAEQGNPAHVAAPMPGVVSGVSIQAAQKVRAGDVILSIEAMKMETALHAGRDGKIAEVLVKAGDQIDAKDLLLRYAD